MIAYYLPPTPPSFYLYGFFFLQLLLMHSSLKTFEFNVFIISTVDKLKLNFLPQMQFMLLFSRQGKLRLQKWYVPLSDKERKKISRDLVQTILARKPKMCSFLEWRDLKIVYKRYVNKTLTVITLTYLQFVFYWWKLQYNLVGFS